jgi:thioredoxin-related protein
MKFSKFLFLFFSFLIVLNGKEYNIDNILKQGEKEDKYIMFYYHSLSCPYCKLMLKENFKDEQIVDQIDKYFIYIDIYTEDKDKITFKDFSGTHKKFYGHITDQKGELLPYPATVFMDSDGKVVHKAIGYRNKDEHLIDIKYVSTKSYKDISLDEYKLKLEMEE